MMQASQGCTTSPNQSGFQVKRLLRSRDRNSSPSSEGKHFLPFAEGIGLAHDAGNLLGALRLYADLLASAELSPKEPQIYAQEIRLIAERSLSLIERLIGCARPPSPSIEAVMLPEILNGHRELLSRLIGRPILVSIRESAYKPIHISREAIERILLNLVKNAAAATPRSGSIRVTLERSFERGSQYIIMTVMDEGIGMSESLTKMLQEDVDPRQARGRGMGLRIVRELVADSGGALEISSSPGRGTKISLKWPEVKTKASSHRLQLNELNVSKRIPTVKRKAC